MTNKEAIGIIRMAKARIKWDHHSMECATGFDMAISALEKQIPKNPNYKAEDRFVKNHFSVYPYCPVCEKEVIAGDMFCVRCGQAIDWEEER